MWKHLAHQNILPFLGVTIAPLLLISAWMFGGNLSEYIETNPDSDPLRPVSALVVDLIPCLLRLLVIRHRQGPLLSPLLQRDSWGPQRSMWLPRIYFHHYTDLRPAKHPHGQLR